MATYNKFDAWVEHLAEQVHNYASDQYRIALTNAANAPVASNSVLADLTEIAYTNLLGRDLVISTSAQTGGLYTSLFADAVLTASGGPVAGFRYVVIYNDTPVSPVDPLQCWYDYGSDLVLSDGETLTVDFTTATFTLQ